MFEVTNNSSSILRGQLPIFDVNIALILTMRTVLSSGTVTMQGDFYLQAGDQLQLRYVNDGFTGNVSLEPGRGAYWSVHRL